MKNKIDLFALYLTKPLSADEIENKLNIKLQKGIEATLYGHIGKCMITYTHFNVLTLINYDKHELQDILRRLDIKDVNNNFTKKYIYQDYPIIIESELDAHIKIDNDKISIKDGNINNLLIISHVISQSVALEVYENKLSDYYEKSRNLIDTSDAFSIFKRTKLSKFAKQLVLIRHDMLIDLYLLDKPNILWDNADIEDIYNKLSYSLELKERFDVVEYKLNNIKDDIVMVMDLTNHNHSSFLEWIIIILIVIEVIMGLLEWFGYK